MFYEIKEVMHLRKYNQNVLIGSHNNNKNY